MADPVSGGEGTAPDPAAALFRGDDPTQALLRRLDWSATGLGAVSGWPPELSAAARTVLPSRVPMLVWWGPDLVQIYNDAARKLLGRKHPGAAGQPASRCWHQMWDCIGPVAKAVLNGSGGTFVEDQLLLIDRSGHREETYWTYSYSPITAAAGQVLGILVAGTEVTSRVVADRRLAVIRALGEVSTSGIGSTTQVCAAAVDVLSRDRASQPFAAIFLMDRTATGLHLAASYGLSGAVAREVRAGPRTAVGRVAVTGTPETTSDLAGLGLGVIKPGPLGPALPNAAIVLPLRTPGQDRPAGVLVLGVSPYRVVDSEYMALFEHTARDVSTLIGDAQAYQAERDRADDMATLERRTAEFYQDLSHELRTPLTLIQGPVAELLADPQAPLAPDHRAGLQAARRAGEHLRRVVDALLDYARAEAGSLQSDVEPTDLAELTTGLVGMFRPGLESKGLRLDMDVEAPPAPVCVDRDMWSAVMANLLSNAVKFTATGHIGVRLQVRDDAVELTVRDTGPGIASWQLPMLFDRFHRGMTRAGGTGIGLALVAALIRARGGRIGVESTPGRGSTFTVTLPLELSPTPSRLRPLDPPADNVTALVADTARRTGAATDPTSQDTTARRVGTGTVLLVEDDRDMREYVSGLLSRDGWGVCAVGDVGAALAVTLVPDLIISDVMLPGRSGIDLVRLVRATPSLVDVPVILLTARAGSDAVAEGLAAGADDYVTKPFHPEELGARVQAHYELSRLRRYALRQAQNEVAHLHVALASNRRIGAAIGILMVSRHITEEQSFTLLREASQHANRKIRDLAETIIRTGALPGERADPATGGGTDHRSLDGKGGVAPSGRAPEVRHET